MNLKEAISRIGWRFGGNGNKKPFPVNKNDIEAFNEVSRYIEQTQKQQLLNNEAFGKLYILAYAKMIEHYGTDILDHKPRKAMIQLLEKPIEDIVTDFQDRLNDWTRWSVLKNLGISLKHPSLQTEQEKKESLEIMEREFKKENFKCDYIYGAWDRDLVEQNLNAEVNHVLNILRKHTGN